MTIPEIDIQEINNLLIRAQTDWRQFRDAGHYAGHLCQCIRSWAEVWTLRHCDEAAVRLDVMTRRLRALLAGNLSREVEKIGQEDFLEWCVKAGRITQTQLDEWKQRNGV